MLKYGYDSRKIERVIAYFVRGEPPKYMFQHANEKGFYLVYLLCNIF